MHIALLGFVVLLSACGGPAENSATSNSNTPQQANSNSQQSLAQGNSPLIPLPVVVQPPDSTANANAAKAAATASGTHVPKLVAPTEKVNFGKQPQDKTIVRAIAIRNGGKADLNIESVTPS